MFGATQGVALEALKNIVRRPESSEQVHVYVFLRNPQKLHAKFTEAGLDADLILEKGTKSTRLTTFKGDALNRKSVNDFFNAVTAEGPLSEVVSSLGATPKELVFTWYKPLSQPRFTAEFENICSDTMRTIVEALQTIVAPRQPDGLAPRLIVVTSNGIGRSTHDALPLLLKPLYGHFLKYPHMDKEKMETFLHESFAIPSADFNAKPKDPKPLHGLASDRLIIVRPSLLTDGARKGAVRSSSSPMPKAWTVSRADVGGFIAGDCMRLTECISQAPIEGGRGYTISY